MYHGYVTNDQITATEWISIYRKGFYGLDILNTEITDIPVFQKVNGLLFLFFLLEYSSTWKKKKKKPTIFVMSLVFCCVPLFSDPL